MGAVWRHCDIPDFGRFERLGQFLALGSEAGLRESPRSKLIELFKIPRLGGCGLVSDSREPVPCLHFRSRAIVANPTDEVTRDSVRFRASQRFGQDNRRKLMKRHLLFAGERGGLSQKANSPDREPTENCFDEGSSLHSFLHRPVKLSARTCSNGATE